MEIKYPVSKPDLTGNEKKYLNKAIESGWVSSQGPYVQEFEEAFAKKHGADYGVACSSGTNALVLAVRAAGIKPGDEVIVPEFTMIATAWAVSIAGGTPRFADCGTDLNMALIKFEDAITEKTRAVIVTHVYGRKANIEAITKLAHEYGLIVIEDSCEAISLPITGDIACFSLFANKVITAGEGGVAVTNDKYLADQMRHLRGMAFDSEHSFHHKKLGYNFRMTNLQAAVALAQLERLDEFLAKRKQIESWYDEALEPLRGRKDITIGDKRDIVWMYDIRVAMRDRGSLIEALKEKGIETRVYFKPMSLQPMYKGPFWETTAFKAAMEGFYLPTYTDLTKADVQFIASVILDFYASKEKKESLQGTGASGPSGAPKQERPPALPSFPS